MADQAWLDTINMERKKDQSGPISYEVFEIIVDKLEKEWFELASDPFFGVVRKAETVRCVRRSSGYLNLSPIFLLRIRDVPCAMTRKEKTPTLLCSAMGAIWQYIRVTWPAESRIVPPVADLIQTAMVFRTSQRVNGFVGNVQSHRKTRSYVLRVP